ncbi:bifunctional enoyl-CoA hydratase/phosphate acetyltransferase [Chitinibacter sp. GC72]|uniref:bifunctional enoyl-CoA hydratase/phosphate acetyltransferase n=1 Tax=Chitinibacter sp. GC72 TaxID=1526917 RepID=UPI0012F9EC37|nr:bifunctional enoyl-CoA hydratase/phosphate acetyltransferase [Chitinibacter sp. GC72]
MSVENLLFADLQIGQQYHRQHLVRRSDIDMLGMMAGKREREGLVSVPAIGIFLFLTATAINSFPGPGSLIEDHQLHAQGWISEDDILSLTLTVSSKDEARKLVILDAHCENQHGEQLCRGPIHVLAPTASQRSEYAEAPQFTLRAHHVFANLRAKTDLLPAIPTAVVHPCDRDSLLSAMLAAQEKLIIPILVGPEAKIRAVAAAEGISLLGVRIVGAEHSHNSAQKAVELCRNGEAQALMKGSLHTDEMMSEVMCSATGLRTARRISHVFVMDVPAYERALLVTDAAINIAPGLAAKADITQNAIDLAHILGIACPKVALLSAVETVTDKMPSTMDAALLCKMADRGQIHGAILDGPLAFDNAISMAAAKTKKINSPVAGQADILVVPDIESGNMLAKQMSYFAAADSAGIVLGARVPIVLTSRADDVKTRLASAAVMVLVAHAMR